MDPLIANADEIVPISDAAVAVLIGNNIKIVKLKPEVTVEVI